VTSKSLKRIIRSTTFKVIICWLVAYYIKFIDLTGSWTENGSESMSRLSANGDTIIAAFWHGRLLMAPTGWQKRGPLSVIISKHNDGELIARTVRHFGVNSIRGSTSRGGATALREMLKTLKNGGNVAITPDGPRGPRMNVQAGIILLARLSGAPIVPVTYAVSRRKVVHSWDRFVIPLPFCRGVYLWGEPLYISKTANEEEMEAARLLLENRLNNLTVSGDKRMGVELITPSQADPR